MQLPFQRFRICACISTFILLASMSGCKEHTTAPSGRTYRMGFQNSAPRYNDINLVLQTLNIWVPSADAAMITTEVPWDTLLNGGDPIQYVKDNYSGLVDFYRQKNLKLWVFIDPANGLNRTSDADALVKRGKSIAQADMQMIYRRFSVVMDSILAPEHLGLALETNLIRLLSPDSIYQGVKQAAHDAAQDVRAMDATVKLSISGQAETAWGVSNGTTNFAGLAQDFLDFPFIQELGISSYPYFAFGRPQDLPLNYYSKLVDGKTFPVFVSEGGWTAKTFPGPSGTDIQGSVEAQRDYITRQGQMLDEAKAIGWFQLSFTDIDITTLPAGTNPTIKYFAYLGLVDVNLTPRPSWNIWNGIFDRPLK